MMKIYIKEGWQLNPNPKVIERISRMVERNNGECPCLNDSEDKHCPCSNYREKDKCCCGLYTRVEEPLLSLQSEQGT